MRKTLQNVAALLAAGLLAAPLALAAGNEIKAVKVDKDPAAVDGPEWGKAKAVSVPMDGVGGFQGKKQDVAVQAVYTKNGMVSMLFTWNDASKSVDGQAWTKSGEAWTQKPGKMDRLALNFEVRRIQNFANKGCAVLCHSEAKDPKEWKYHTAKAPQFGDLWVWDSYTSAPLGHAGDYLVDDDSRKADKGSGKATMNINKTRSGPLYMQDPAKKPSAAGFLMDNEKADIDAKTTETPAWMLNTFSGDFADIKAVSRHDGKQWKVMLQRKLKTGSETDVEFDVKKDYNLGIAVFDDSAMYDKFASGPLKLKFD